MVHVCEQCSRNIEWYMCVSDVALTSNSNNLCISSFMHFEHAIVLGVPRQVLYVACGDTEVRIVAFSSLLQA